MSDLDTLAIIISAVALLVNAATLLMMLADQRR